MMLRRLLATLSCMAILSGQALATTSSASPHETTIIAAPKSQPISGELRLLGETASEKKATPKQPIVAKIDISEQRMNVYVNGLITP